MKQGLQWSASTLACVAVLAICPAVLRADWTRFRGPNGTGVAADEEATPVEWSNEKNLRWKIDLPGAGVSSPIVVGDRVFVTCYTGYGVEGGSDNVSDLVRHLICLDTKTGEEVWRRDVPSTVTEDPYAGIGVTAHGYASHTPASDGQHVFAFFGKTGVIAFTMDGEEVWRTSVGENSDPRRWGSSSSPIVFEDTIIVAAGPESRAVVGLDKKTGKELWRAEAEGLGNVWGTPAVVKTDKYTDIVLGAPYEIWAINPENGKLNWYCEAMETDSFNSSVVVDGEVVYAIEGRGGGSIAVKAGGTDDVTNSQVVWSGRDNGRFGSPVVFEGRLYNFNSGIATCIDAKTGEEIFKARLRGGDAPSEARGGPPGGGRGGFGGPPGDRGGPPGGQRGGAGGGRGGFGGPGGPGGQGGRGGRGGRGGFGGGGMGGDYASPVIADGKVYYTNRGGDVYVIEATDSFNQLAVNNVGEEGEQFGATPAISDGAIYLRSNKHLYCVAAE